MDERKPEAQGPATQEKRPVGRPKKIRLMGEKFSLPVKVSEPIQATPTGPTTNFSNREQAFLHAYFDANSPTKGKGKESASLAGFSDHRLYAKILKKYEDQVFAGALESVGLSKLTLAFRLKRIIDDERSDPRDVLAATKLMLSVMGERTETGNSVNVNVATQPKSLVMIGFEGEGLSNMLRGKKPLQLENKNGESEASVVEGGVVSADSEVKA
jgi:hypothetical protein